MSDHPPLTDPDCDLRDFQFMPLDVVRLAQSDLVATEDPAAIVANLLLWCASWHSVPAASLTDDDRSLARLAGYGRGVTEFQAIKRGALRGWIKCSDGRLYHPVVAEKAREAFKGKLAQRHRTFLAAVRKHNERDRGAGGDDQRDPLSYDAWLDAGRPSSAVRAAPKSEQQALPLDNVTRDEPHMSRVTEENVTRDDGGMSRVTSRSCHAEKRSKGQGQGQGEGQGQGDSNNNNNRESATRDDDDAGKPDPMDLASLTAKLARRAGVPISQPRAIASNMDVVKAWTADAIPLDRIEKAIDDYRTDNPDERISTLRFFDQGIRARIASDEARARKRRPSGTTNSIAAPPVQALATSDGADPRVAEIRKILNGEPSVSPDKLALSIRADVGEDTLLAVARSEFVKANVDLGKLKDAAHAILGSFAVEITVQ
jgi:hypothetical protein